MTEFQAVSIVIVWGTLLSGCVTGSSSTGQVRITRNAADVTACTQAGRIKVPRNEYGDVNKETAAREYRRQTAAFGGNTAFVREGPLGAIVEAIAYRCPRD